MTIKKLREYVSTGSFARNVTLIAGGTALGQGVLVLVSPILTRLYQPDDFGLLAVFISIFSILVAVNSLRYELAIPLADDQDTAASLVVLVLALVVLTTIIFGIVFVLFGDQLARLVRVPELSAYTGLLLLSLLGGGFYQALSYWAIRQKAFSPIARTKFAQNFGMAATQLILGLLQAGIGGLLFGHAVGQFGGTLTLARLAWRENRSAVRRVNLASLAEAARRYRRFPLYASWSGLLNVASIQLPTVLITILYGAHVAGWFALGQRVVGLPMALIGTAVGQVYMSRASQIARENRAQLPALYSRAARNLFAVGILPIIILAVSGTWLFAFVFGADWRTAGEYVQIMSPMFIVQFVVSSLSPTIYVVERQDVQLLWDAARLALVAGVFILSAALQFSPSVCLTLYAITMCITYLILFWLNRRAVQQYVRTVSHV